MRKEYRVAGRHRELNLGARTWIMGIINVTPDSFHPGTRSGDAKGAVNIAAEMIRQGADILDVGGESTRPGAEPVMLDEELRRVIPVIRTIRGMTGIPVSVDTRKSEVAAAALETGADLVNDVSGFRDDPAMAEVVARYGAAAVVMHLRGNPKTMQLAPPSDDILSEARSSLQKSLDRAAVAGLSRDKIIIDPGIGFGKSPQDNLQILRNLDFLQELDRPILVGPSRKSFIETTLAGPDEDCDRRLWGTAAAVTSAILAGAHIIRVHDVAAMKSVAAIADALARIGHA